MINIWTGIGRIGHDAEMIPTADGTPTAKFQIAVDKKPRGSGTDWIPCSLYGDRAKLMTEWLTKGRMVGITGNIASYKDKKGNFKLIINVDEINMLDQHKEKEQPKEEFAF